jgi:Zn-dependent metalloprotease
VYDGESRAALPGKLRREEGAPPVETDASVNAAYDAAGCTYALFDEVYQRSSLDGKGLPLILTVHHRRNHNNAYWNGSQMLFGDGDDEVFVRNGFARSLSVVGHELTHGVVQFAGGLAYSGESGALNEHIADVFGVLTEQYMKKQAPHEATWLIGEGLIASGDAAPMSLRSMAAPGTAYEDHPMLGDDPQPYHMRGYVRTLDDDGGVHINSGIPNHAFYLFARSLGGSAWKDAGLVWYDALIALNQPYASFVTWAEATSRAAAKRFGIGTNVPRALERAWRLVGL